MAGRRGTTGEPQNHLQESCQVGFAHGSTRDGHCLRPEAQAPDAVPPKEEARCTKNRHDPARNFAMRMSTVGKARGASNAASNPR